MTLQSERDPRQDLENNPYYCNKMSVSGNHDPYSHMGAVIKYENKITIFVPHLARADPLSPSGSLGRACFAFRTQLSHQKRAAAVSGGGRCFCGV